MKNGWTKYFLDETSLEGLDKDIASGKCSWSKSLLNNIIKCSLRYSGHEIILSGIGNYWQSDDFEINIGTNESIILKRRLEKQITDSDHAIVFSQLTPKKHLLEVVNLTNLLVLQNQIGSSIKKIELIEKENINKWLILDLNTKTSNVSYRFSAERI